MKNLKTIITIFTLFFLGILAGLYVDAMTYIINGNYTQIIIPTNYSSGITINRGEENSETNIQNVTNCEELPSSNEIDEPVYKCTHSYATSGYHEVRIENQNEKIPSKISLDSGNVTNIKNFSGFENLTEIYLRNNNIDTIPQPIWETRNQIKTIKFSNTTKYNNENGTKYIDLTNNPIKFLGLTKIGSYNLSLYPLTTYPVFHNTKIYNFEWFSFYNNNNLTYDYIITDNPINSTLSITKTGITNTGIIINDIQLNSGTYYFKACIHNTETCEGRFFNVNYDESIYFTGLTHPTSGEILSKTENIQFTRERSGNFPNEYISGYSYTLSKNETEIIHGFTGNTSFNLDSDLLGNDPNGNYIFTINLINTNNTIISSTKRNFIISIPKISIKLPNSEESTLPVQFSWDYYLPSPYIFTGYIGTISKGNEIIKTKTLNTINNTGFKLDNLKDGNYSFLITMKYLNSGVIENVYDIKTFTITNQTNTNGGSNGGHSTNNNTNNNTTSSLGTGNNLITGNINSQTDTNNTNDEVYIARNCKEYIIKYSESLNAFTSPNLKRNEYFVNKEYFKRYIDSKNPYKKGCPTNVGWINKSYIDTSNNSDRYIAPNGKIYFITGEEGNYYSNEINKSIKSYFKTLQELKYYIRDRNPLISMGYLGTNEDSLKETNSTKTLAIQKFNEIFKNITDLEYPKYKDQNGIDVEIGTSSYKSTSEYKRNIVILKYKGSELEKRYFLQLNETTSEFFYDNEDDNIFKVTENDVINNIIPIFEDHIIEYMENITIQDYKKLPINEKKERDVSRKSSLSQLQTAIVTYQGDKGYWPGMEKGATNGISISKIKNELTSVGLKNIPTDPISSTNNYGLGILNENNSNLGEYTYLVTKRNGVKDAGFILMAKTEDSGMSNRIVCENKSGLSNGYIGNEDDLKNINLCQNLKKGNHCSTESCTYTNEDELRYINIF